MKPEILWNEDLNEYTLDNEINDVKSIKKIPMKFKLNDKNSKFRKEILKKDLFK